MSHELRTPLNAILGFAQLLELEELTAEQRENLHYILSAARHLLGLINEVLDIASIEAGRLALSLEPVAVADVVAETTSLIRPLADQHQVLMVSPPVSCQVHVLGDRQRLKQILLNLLSNAVKYNRQGGTVQLECGPGAEGRLRVTVADTGPGVRLISAMRPQLGLDLAAEHDPRPGPARPAPARHARPGGAAAAPGPGPHGQRPGGGPLRRRPPGPHQRAPRPGVRPS